MRFSVADPAIATVSDSGKVSAHERGGTTVTVTAGDKSVEIPVTVVESYALTLLGTLGGDESLANDINESGQVVGTAQAADGTWHAFLWEDGTMRDLGSGGFDRNSAYAINDHGTVVGTAGPQLDGCFAGGCETQLWMWSDGEMRAISIEGVTLERFTDVNNRGQVTGYTSAGYYRWTYGDAFIWEDGEVTWLGKFGTRETGEAKWARAMAINDDGIVAANMTYYANGAGVIWRDGEFTPLDPVGLYSTATAVNDAGVVVGMASGSLVTWRDGELTQLPGGRPHDIDNAGRIVGTHHDRGFLWDGTSLIHLSNVLPVDAEYEIIAATAINEAGQIVGHGIRPGAVYATAFLLTPAP
jgi:probable HAF family extracellular repeat protein